METPMRVSEIVACLDFPCTDVRHGCYAMPPIEADAGVVSVVLISEAAAAEPADD